MDKKALTKVEAVAFVAVIIIAFAGGYLAGTLTAPAPAPAVTVITVWALWGGIEEANFRKAIDAFNVEVGAEKGILAKYESQSGVLREVATTQFAAKKSDADVIIAPWPEWISQELAPEGLVEDLTDLVNEIGTDKFPEAYIDVVKSDGKIWAVPFKAWAKPGFWYMTKTFQRLGLTPPKTWDEFLNVLERLKQAGITPLASGDGVGWPLSDLTEAFIIAFGGPDMQRQLIEHKIAWNDPRVKDVFRRLIELHEKGYFDELRDWTLQIDRMMQEKVGIYFMGNWISLMLEERGAKPEDIGFFPFPGTNGLVAGGDWAFIPTFAKNKEAAKVFLKWLAGPRSQEIMVRLKGFLATNKDVPAEAYGPADKAVVDFMGKPGIQVLPDLDDNTPSEFQTFFWGRLKDLWANPAMWESILDDLERKATETIGPVGG